MMLKVRGGAAICLPRTWSASRPPIWLLSLTYCCTVVLMNASKSSIDSGSGSAAVAAAFGVCDAVFESSRADCSEGGGEDAAPWGSSMVEEAMSSSRAVAASSLVSTSVNMCRLGKSYKGMETS